MDNTEDPSKIQEDMARIEYIICTKMRPTFLVITITNNNLESQTIEILLSCLAFKRMTVQERISSIFNLLILYCPDILKERLIVVQAYDSNQIEDVIDTLITAQYEDDSGNDDDRNI